MKTHPDCSPGGICANTHRYYYRISQLERLTKTGRRTIHFYVDTGLLHSPVKSGKTMAYYDEHHVRKLLFIRKAKKKGLPLIAIRAMIESGEADHTSMESLQKTLLSRKDRKRQPKKPAGKATRDRIIVEGSRLFLEKGFKETRVNDLIHRLEIGKGSFYSYFPHKKALFLECVPLIFERFFAQGWEAIRKEKHPYKRLMLRAEITLPVLDEFFAILQMIQDAAKDPDQSIRTVGEHLYRSICQPLEEDIQTGITKGIFKNVNPRLYSLVLISTMKGMNDILTLNPDITPESLKDALLDILSHGLITERNEGP
ncbi:MAG: MerR family transcriptional regulator [Desulfomonilia bacterium]|nr:MerR family transcriptional regulator [Desulfomonilia bacterium]